MLVPLSWLKEYVEIEITPQELEKKLFSCGERKILCKLPTQFNDIRTINFFVDRDPCSICSYSIDQMDKWGIDIELFYIC